jgi:ATPase subunit of ABC transporter with duplicated ATPase domains
MRFGSKILFEDVTTAFSPGRRYGLTGPNGAGKSTFMKLLTGDTPPQKGTVTRPAKVGVLRQDQFAFDQFRVVDTVIMGNTRLWSALEEREHLYNVTDMTDEQGMRLAELEGIVGEEDGYTAESDAAILLDGLDIPEALHARKMSELQGGQKVRVLLAQALFGHPQALLLDEPTNHLDLDSIHWLCDFLVRYEGTLIVISHDRHFLNAVTTHTADIDYQTIITYTGGYDDMVIRRRGPLARRKGERSARKDRAAAGVHRALLGRHALGADDVPAEGSGAAADDRARALEHPAAVHQLQDEPFVGADGDGDQGRREGIRERQ